MSKTRAWIAGAAVALTVTTGAMAQEGAKPDDQQPAINSSESLRLPENPQVFGTAMPSVVKATAIVNGDVITQTDVGQRLQLLAIANGGQIPAQERQRLGGEGLRNPLAEKLPIPAAQSEKIEIKQ